MSNLDAQCHLDAMLDNDKPNEFDCYLSHMAQVQEELSQKIQAAKDYKKFLTKNSYRHVDEHQIQAAEEVFNSIDWDFLERVTSCEEDGKLYYKDGSKYVKYLGGYTDKDPSLCGFDCYKEAYKIYEVYNSVERYLELER